jgi:uncharacterized protein YoxC
MSNNVTLERVDARMKEIANAVADGQKQIEALRTEYNQLLGYRQALLDVNNTTNEETVLNENENEIKNNKGA